MPTTLGLLRRRVLAPPLQEVTFARRGFPVSPTAATRRLEAIPQSVVCGFEWAIEARDAWEVERRLELVEPELRGFAYEGATMAFTVRDAMGRGRRAWAQQLLLGPGRPHVFLTYIGIGFAMARLPRPLWKRVVPDLDGLPYHPTMSWLAVDGYGFDLAYFSPRRWVDGQEVPRPYPWEGRADYFPRAVDQGIGRALWFISGARPDAVAGAVARFGGHRHADLWSGVGLAATFAGGCDRDGLHLLGRRAGRHRDSLAQGAVFAAKARQHSGIVAQHTETAVCALAGLSTAEAAALADRCAVGPGERGPVPPYELWRAEVRKHFC